VHNLINGSSKKFSPRYSVYKNVATQIDTQYFMIQTTKPNIFPLPTIEQAISYFASNTLKQAGTESSLALNVCEFRLRIYSAVIR
jgi:hypothetical protein